ncbi:MAG: hypothetical protein L3J82_05780 [Planctomycetes bacterium]|nr:hypothetical protein [Planctomycetota bacterium]
MLDGQLRFDLSFSFHSLTRLVYGSDYLTFDELGEKNSIAAEHGDADFFVFQTDIRASYMVSDSIGLSLQLPIRTLTLRVDDDDEHHRDETYAGAGDTRLSGSFHFISSNAFQLVGSAGISLPTGRLNEVTASSYIGHDEAMDLGVTVPEHSHLQLGTGTLDPSGSVQALYNFDEMWAFSGSISLTYPMYYNRYNYRTAPSGTVLFGSSAKFDGTGLTAALFLELFYSGRDRYDGEDVVGTTGTFKGQFGIPNTGRFEAALQPAAYWTVMDGLALSLSLRIPVYTAIAISSDRSDVQLTEIIGATLGGSWTF